MSHGMEVSGVCLLRPQTDPQPRPQRPLQKGLEQPKKPRAGRTLQDVHLRFLAAR